ncbi:MazG family protein [Parachlamydia sp. AcF125]|uniref:MazG family protein n=1 Tax=Parachlamydia sp. AcF125 TaxID=2795736 RepID=UPI001BD90A3C|nr:MazG family protein [Parachlamydia sp. AcF125]MBS4168550.1 Nucleoside triphosphate pyrophosphohydrolase [Parachlamydia sp. AcF125]
MLHADDESLLQKIRELLSVLNTLLGPNGCPWDREQTLETLRSTLLEEAAEWVEAVDLGDAKHMEEELGDLFLNLFFISKLAQKEGKFQMDEPVSHVIAKLIRRHPHVFSDKKLKTAEEVTSQWEALKQQEKQERKSILDGISKALPALMRGAKIGKKIKKTAFPLEGFKDSHWECQDEESIGNTLFSLVLHAENKKIDPEMALRKTLSKVEQHFRKQEGLVE